MAPRSLDGSLGIGFGLRGELDIGPLKARIGADIQGAANADILGEGSTGVLNGYRTATAYIGAEIELGNVRVGLASDRVTKTWDADAIDPVSVSKVKGTIFADYGKFDGRGYDQRGDDWGTIGISGTAGIVQGSLKYNVYKVVDEWRAIWGGQ